MSVVNQLRQYGDDIENRRVIEKVLRSLPKKFEPIVVPIEEFKYLSQTQIDELTGSLIAHESRMSRYDNPLENTFKSQFHVTRGRGIGRSSIRGRGCETANHRDLKSDSEYEEKTQQNPPIFRGSNIRSW